ncbi:hypothetical protein C474_03125 [Halogeometricum pallidum JCM 14848]|uniref:Ferredoxin n=1 Tax=Halogeometricum pallidum JCM 14848 TaxID=1227487 RepID=M0DGI8_HALPD|nr:ferredoxin [Halogeometricum pallidum]ELZ33918.1 hypothetical protein C474_03125 [Halogeometricum pallidum JCM 14848]
MTTEYQIRLDRDACDGIFACLVRDDRFVEASDGLVTVEGGRAEQDGDGSQLVSFNDDRLADARQAARSCPVGAIDVLTEVDDE